MAVNGFISQDMVKEAELRPIRVVARHEEKKPQAAAVIENVLRDLKAGSANLLGFAALVLMTLAAVV